MDLKNYTSNVALLPLVALVFNFIVIVDAPLIFGQTKPIFPTAPQSSWQQKIQNLKVHHIGIEAGLSQGTNYTLLKDSRGFLWFTSYEGLNRYDGHRVEVFRNGERACEMSGNNTNGLIEDKKGNIWFGTEKGLNVWWLQEDCFQFIPVKDSSAQVIPTLTYPFHADSLSVWYFNDLEGIVRYFLETKKKEIISAEWKYSQSNNRINSIKFSSDGKIWIRDEIGIIQYDPKTQERNYYFSPHLENKLGNPTLIYSITEKDSDYWLGADQQIIRFNPIQGEVENIDLSPWLLFSKIADIKIYQDSLLWLGSGEEGSFVFNPRSRAIIPFTKKNGLSNNSCANLIIDKAENVWINVDPHGINQVSRNFTPFQNFTSIKTGKKQLQNLGVKRFLEMPDGKIWIGTELSGIILFNPMTNTIEDIVQIGQSYQNFSNQGNAFWLEKGEILWIGTFFGISRFNLKTKIFLEKITFPKIADANHIWDLKATKNGTLWIATDGGLFYKLPNESKIQRLEGLKDIRVNRIQEDAQGRLFIIEHFNGIHLLPPNVLNLPPSVVQEKQRHLFPNKYIKHFYHDENNKLLWLATDDGFLKVQTNDWTNLKIIKTYRVADGLLSNFIYSILPDPKGYLWLSTNKGIARFAPGNEQFSVYGPDDGLQGYEYNTNSFLQSNKGDLYFGGVNGFNKFAPNTIKEAPISPRPEFIGLKINEQPYKKAGYIGAINKLALNHQQNTLELTFVSPDYFNKGRNEYQYQLKNYDKTWIKAGQINFARYTKLPPGDYTFMVQSSNCHFWNTNSKVLAIKIFPPWWQTYWAYVLYAILSLLLLYTIYQFLINKKLTETETKRLLELDNLKTKLYTNITHEFRTPLTVIQGMTDELENRPKHKPKEKLHLIKKNSQNLLNLVNQMLDLSKLQASRISLNLQQADVIFFLKLLTESHESFAKLHQIDLQFYSEEDNLLMDFDEKKIEQVMINLLTNAIKFTPEYGKILVVVKRIGKSPTSLLEIKIKDTGIGIAAEETPYIFDRFHQSHGLETTKGTGIGLALVKELVNLMKGAIIVKSELQKGATFILSLPIQNKAPLIQNTKSYPFQKPVIIDVQTVSISESDRADLPILLIIEDNIDVIYYLQNCLEERYQVITSTNGKAGLAKAFEALPDIIISDVMMPEMDGFEVCQQLKTDERTNHIPIILLTAKATQKDKLAGLNHGADVYLLKPFEKEELLIRLDNLMKLRRLLQLKYSQQLLTEYPLKEKEESVQDAFIRKAEQIILDNLKDENFGGNELAKALHLSYSQIYRKIKVLTGKSVTIYIRHIRLQKAKILLLSKELTISEIAYQIGFKSPVYFSQVFKALFGKAPSAFRDKEQEL